MSAERLKLPTFECLRCGHRWHPAKEERPACCPFCKDPRWDVPPKREAKARARHAEECAACLRKEEEAQ